MKRNNPEIVAIFDIDKTLLPGFTIIDFAKFLAAQKTFTEAGSQAMDKAILDYSNKSIDYNQFADQIVNSYALGIGGQDLQAVEEQAKIFWEQRFATIFPFVPGLFDLLERISAHKIAVSGSTADSLAPLIQRFAFQEAFLTRIKTDQDQFLNEVLVNAASHSQKEKIIEEIFEALVPGTITLGFGDSVADLAFLRKVTHPFVVGEQDKKLVAEAEQNSWPIIRDYGQDVSEIVRGLLTGNEDEENNG